MLEIRQSETETAAMTNVAPRLDSVGSRLAVLWISQVCVCEGGALVKHHLCASVALAFHLYSPVAYIVLVRAEHATCAY